MANEAQIKAVITADDRASSVLKGFGSHVESIGNKVADVAKVAAIGIAAAGAAATAFAVSSVKAFEDSQNQIAQTNAVLKSTGGVAGIAAFEVTKLANSLQKTTKFSDEEVRSAENLLLTFTAIGKDIFPQATKTVLDMATALGEDTKSASIQLGKALQDPILGITALRRVGVNFSDKQKDVIQSLVDTGKKAEAQKLILKELQVEFGGSAEAAGKTFAGQLAILKNSFNDVQESIGLVIVKGLTPLVGKMAEFLNKFQWEAIMDAATESIKSFFYTLKTGFTEDEGTKIEAIALAVRETALQIKQWAIVVIDVANQVADYLQPKVVALWHTFQDDLIPVLVRLWREVIEPLIPVIGTLFVVAVGAVIDIINALMKVLAPAVDWMLNHKGTVEALAASFGILALSMNFSAIVAAFNAAINSAIIMVNIFRLVTIPNALASMSTFAAGFGPIGIAAVLAAALIIDAGNRAKAAWDNTRNAIERAAATDDATIRQLQQLIATGTPEQQQRAKITLNALAAEGSFATGGYTGEGSTNEIAGIVHKGEYVVPQNQVDQATGLPKMGGGSVNININVGALMGSDVEARKFAQLIIKHYRDAMGSKSSAVMI